MDREIETRVGDPQQLGGITPLVFTEGRARGVRALMVQTGSGLAFTTVADRALDICSAEFRGTNLVWRSQAGVAAPQYYHPLGDDFERNFFGGLITTCGLGNFGPPGHDRWGSFGMHGRINHLPAENVMYSRAWRGDRCVLEITGTVREAALFGENLCLNRTLRTHIGSKSLTVSDRVINEGSAERPHMLLYHCNMGFPLLDSETRLYASQNTLRARDAAAKAGLADWDRGADPRADFKEQVFIHEPRACADGRCAVVIVNRALNDGRGLALAVRFKTEQLPALFTWRMLAEKTYVMAVEPANCPTIEGRVEAAASGTLPFLAAGEERSYELEFTVLDTPTEIDAMIDTIEGRSHRDEAFTTPTAWER